MESDILNKFLKGEFWELAKVSQKPNEIFRVYGLFRLGDFQGAKRALSSFQINNLENSFELELSFLLKKLILKDNLQEDTIEITSDILKPLELETRINNDNELIRNLNLEEELFQYLDDSNNHIYGFILKQIGDYYRLKHSNEEAFNFYAKSEKFAERISNIFLKIDLMINLSELYRRNEEYGIVDKLLDDALNLADKNNYYHGIQLYHQTSGTNLFRKAEYQLAKKHVKKSLVMRGKYGNDAQIAHSKMILGMIYLNISDYGNAKSELEASYGLYEKDKNEDGMANINSLLAFIYEHNAKFSKAILTQEEIYQYWQNKNDEIGMGDTLISIGRLQSKIGQYNKALNCLFQAKELVPSTSLQMRGRISFEIGDIHRIRAEFDRALSNFEESYDFFKRVGNPHEEANLLERLGILNYFIGKPKDAESKFLASLVLKEEIGNDTSVAGLYFWIIKCFISQKKNKKDIQNYFNDLELIYNRSDNIFVQLFYYLTQLSLNLESLDLIKLGEAKNIVTQLLDQNITEPEFHLNFNLIYLEILLIEYTQLNNTKIYEEIVERTNDLIAFTKELGIISYFGELNLVLARVFQHNGKFDQAESLLVEALNVTLDRSMYRIALLLSKELDILTDRKVLKGHSYKIRNIPYNLLYRRETITFEDDVMIEEAGKVIIFLDKSWKLLHHHIFINHGTIENEISTLVKMIKQRLESSSNINLLSYFFVNNYKIILLNSKVKSIYVFEGSLFLASEKLKMLNNRIQNSTVLNSENAFNNKNEHYLQYELENILNGIFTSTENKEDEITQIKLKSLSNSDEFGEFLHPIKILIMHIFDRNFQIPRSLIQKLVNVNPGTLKRHLDSLLKAGYIEKSMEFINENPRDMYSIRPKGIIAFAKFKEQMKQL